MRSPAFRRAGGSPRSPAPSSSPPGWRDDVTSPLRDAAWRRPSARRPRSPCSETTDLHTNVLSAICISRSPPTTRFARLERVSTLIAQARAQYPNTLLLDNGDTIQEHRAVGPRRS